MCIASRSRHLLAVDVSVLSIQQCFNGAEVGRMRKGWKTLEKCLNCSKEKHDKGVICETQPSCVNCQGDHSQVSSQFSYKDI